MLKPKVPGGKTNQSRPSQKYVREVDRGAKSGPLTDRITTGVTVPSEFRPAINYILEALLITNINQSTNRRSSREWPQSRPR